MSRPRPIPVSNHAVRRWLERVCGVDLGKGSDREALVEAWALGFEAGAVRQAIRALVRRGCQTFTDFNVRIVLDDGRKFWIVVRSRNVITVTPRFRSPGPYLKDTEQSNCRAHGG